MPPPSPGSATRNPELGRRFERARPDGLREPRVVSGPTPRLAKKSIRTQLHSLRRKSAPRNPHLAATPGTATRPAHPDIRPLHPHLDPPRAPAPGRYTRTPRPPRAPGRYTRPAHPAPRRYTPHPAATPGQVHPTARSIASHRALRIQLNAGLQLLGTVSEPKRNNTRTRFPLPNHRQAPRPDFLSRATSSSEKDRASR